MPDISKIKLPGSNQTYDIKDTVARNAVANRFSYTICTDAGSTPSGVTWKSGSTTITGTLDAGVNTMYKIYLVPSSHGDIDTYEEYISINTTGSTYVWNLIGNTGADLSGLGALAFKDSGTVTHKPKGSISFTNSNASVSFGTTNKTAAVSPAASGTVTYTPGGTVGTPTISLKTAGSTTTVNSITAVGTLPSWSGTVSDETLTITWSQGTLPTKGDNTTVKTGDGAYQSSQPSWTGTGVRLVTGNIAVPNSGTVSVPSSASFSGTEETMNVSFS